MNKPVIVFPVLAMAVTLAAGCSRDETGEAKAPPAGSAATGQPAATPPATAETAGKAPEAATASELAGTSWQLVNIQSMDDNTYAPDDPAAYNLAFLADGSMRLLADCNRGTGSWSSEAPGQLQFGDIAATQAMCLPGSLHDRYISQFKRVRSYVIKDGHLFLATMADGSIIEFEPAGEAARDPYEEWTARSGDALVVGTDYHATGNIDCAMGEDQPAGSCPFGVKREGNGTGMVVVTKPDGRTRAIFFENGRASGYDMSEADPGEFSATKEGDTTIVRIGPERYEIFDAVIWGG